MFARFHYRHPMHPWSLKVRLPQLIPWIALGVTLSLPLSAADSARRGATETALDRYVAKPDDAYAWKKAAEVSEPGTTGYALDLVSQRWLTPAEVNRPEWRHWLTIIKPDTVEHPTALLFVSGGSNRPGNPPRPARELIELAKTTRSVVAELRMVPNQPLVFHGDGAERKEDDLIAYTWDQFLRTGDERWPARLPMTKATVRAMDAVTEFLAQPGQGATKVETFVVAGASKRGWTTWSTAAVDRRVVAICPIVIDVLNVEKSIEHHFRAYGAYSTAIADYERHGIMKWMGAPESRALYAIEDPLSYRDRLTMPKLLLNATGDQFFLPDSSQFYFDALPGQNHLRYLPNTDHGLKNSDWVQTLTAWYRAQLKGTRLPRITWTRDATGTVTVKADLKPQSVLLWQATNPAARDFRLEKIGPAWKSSPLEESNGSYRATVSAPAKGWTASFVEMSFDLGSDAPLKLTTDVAVLPKTLPSPPPKATPPRGFLSGAN